VRLLNACDSKRNISRLIFPCILSRRLLSVSRAARVDRTLPPTVSSREFSRAPRPPLSREFSSNARVPPVVGADLRAALVASCFLGALPPVDLRAVCFVRAMAVQRRELPSRTRLRELFVTGTRLVAKFPLDFDCPKMPLCIASEGAVHPARLTST
jgi:hypothetical protein